MKKKLISVFFGIYILLGVLGFFVVTYVGSHLLENQLEKSISSDMYQTAHPNRTGGNDTTIVIPSPDRQP